jgi:D-xylose transport system permease protein
MSIESPGDQEERSQAVPGATSAVVSDEPEVPEEAQKAGGWSLRDLVRGDLGQLPVFIGLVLIAIGFQIRTNGAFLSSENLTNLADQVVSVPVLGLGIAAALVLLIGEIDLSLSAVAYFCGAVTGVLSVHHGWPAVQAMLAGIVVGTAIGLINGFFVAVLRMPSFIVTLAGFIFYQGALSHILQPQTTLQIIDPTIVGIENYVLPTYLSILLPAVILALYAAGILVERARRQRAGLPVQPMAQVALQVGVPAVLVAVVVAVFDNYQGVPLPTVITMALILIFWLVTTKTSFGRHIYAVGGNAEAARRAGIKVVGLRIAIFTLASTIAAMCGLLIDARSVSAAAQVNQYLLLFAIAGAVIGGVSLFGGRGSMWGVVIGALVVGTLYNGLALLNVGPDVVLMAAGLVLVIAVLIDAVARRRSVTGYR